MIERIAKRLFEFDFVDNEYSAVIQVPILFGSEYKTKKITWEDACNKKYIASTTEDYRIKARQLIELMGEPLKD